MAAPSNSLREPNAEPGKESPSLLAYPATPGITPIRRGQQRLSNEERFPLLVQIPNLQAEEPIAHKPVAARPPRTFWERLWDADLMFWAVIGVGALVAVILIAGSGSSARTRTAKRKPATTHAAAPSVVHTPPPAPATEPIPTYRESAPTTAAPQTSLPVASAPSAMPVPNGYQPHEGVPVPGEAVAATPEPPASSNPNEAPSTRTADRQQRISESARREVPLETLPRATLKGIIKTDAQPSTQGTRPGLY